MPIASILLQRSHFNSNNDASLTPDGARSLMFPAKEGLSCHAWLFSPKAPSPNPEGHPVVIMAHGFAAQKDFGLEKYARHFADNGIAAFLFDYRHFGGSQGSPRNLIEVGKQHEDWFSAIDFVSDELNNDGDTKIDPNRIAIWGSSFAGGHVIAVSATYRRKERIKAVVSQVPHADGFFALPNLLMINGPIWGFKLTVNALTDMVRNALGFSRHYMVAIDESLKADGKGSSDTALLATSECALYHDIVPEQRLGGWQNKVPASIGLTFPFYRPTSVASQVTAPVLGVAAKKDTLCPFKGVKGMFEGCAGPTTIKILEGGHFDAYLSEFDRVIEWETSFLKDQLNPSKPTDI